MSELNVEQVKAMLRRFEEGDEYEEGNGILSQTDIYVGSFYPSALPLFEASPSLARAYLALAAECDALRQAGLDLLAALQVLEAHALPMLAIHGDLLPADVLAHHTPKVKAALALLAPAEAKG